MTKITLKDVARKAGVGTATVERVVNGRGGVRPETVEKVFLAVRKLNYRHVMPEAHRGLVRIEGGDAELHDEARLRASRFDPLLECPQGFELLFRLPQHAQERAKRVLIIRLQRLHLV